jgi:MFS family permease
MQADKSRAPDAQVHPKPEGLSPPTGTRPTLKIGAALVLAACAMAVVVHLHPEKLRAPAWVAFFALGLFGLAGLCIVVQALRLDSVARWLACVLLGAMAVVPAWIAFGSGPRQCTVAGLGARSIPSEVLCRGAFGAGAVLVGFMFVFAVRAALRSRRRPDDSSKAARL